MAWEEHVHFYIDSSTWGGIVCERLLAAIVLADNLYCGLVFGLGTTGAPTVEFWAHIDDLERSGFTAVPAAKARAISDALPRFLEQLERAEKEARQTKRAARNARRQRWSAFDPTPDVPAYPPEMESRLDLQKAGAVDPDAYEGG